MRGFGAEGGGAYFFITSLFDQYGGSDGVVIEHAIVWDLLTSNSIIGKVWDS